MKRSISILFGAIIFLTAAGAAFAWGDDGHQAVGKIASLRINTRTARKIAQILKPGETLASIATWADTVKERMGKTDPDPDTNAFLQDMAHNEKNREWHYDDLPLNCKSYQTCTGFTPDNDIVHMLNICIRTLQGHPDPNHPLSQRNALRLLVHFLGDIHQLTDSMRLSRDHTYQSVKIVGQRTIPVLSHGQPLVRDGHPVMQTVFDITRAANYESANRQVVRQQLAKGGFRLAKLLDAIFAAN